MKRQRLRPAHSREALRTIYATPHCHTRWNDHNVRVDVTIGVARGFGAVESVADLSCGDATIARALEADLVVLGDMAPGYELVGPIEETLERCPKVDLFVCSETLEHLDDPDAVLKAIRSKTDKLVVSTPLEAWGESNLEHYWAWDREELERMFEEASFELVTFNALDMRPGWSPYCFGIWALR